jgi:hypothetical protein
MIAPARAFGPCCGYHVRCAYADLTPLGVPGTRPPAPRPPRGGISSFCSGSATSRPPAPGTCRPARAPPSLGTSRSCSGRAPGIRLVSGRAPGTRLVPGTRGPVPGRRRADTSGSCNGSAPRTLPAPGTRALALKPRGAPISLSCSGPALKSRRVPGAATFMSSRLSPALSSSSCGSRPMARREEVGATILSRRRYRRFSMSGQALPGPGDYRLISPLGRSFSLHTSPLRVLALAPRAAPKLNTGGTGYTSTNG